MSNSSRPYEEALIKHTLISARTQKPCQHIKQRVFVVKAKGKKGLMSRQFNRPPPPLPKIEDDGNPRFVVFIRMANVYLWYPLSIISGGTTAKIMVAAKDNFLGKYIYKDTLARNLAAVIYRENNNLRAALATSDVIELPTQAEIKTVIDKVKDFFGDAKESFGKLTALDINATEKSEEKPEEKPK
ncbi:hypothetical protein Acr_07g0016740 [Actinidia rufa]|uniref:Protein HHL1, chloroplastic n=1 Tax=Actinidia rufa TaxID=165716 RepID=A0A7J0EYJ2_9ERIC|nr:hypothetical protein Acr_07g0016740 [Actinidia rufa]